MRHQTLALLLLALAACGDASALDADSRADVGTDVSTDVAPDAPDTQFDSGLPQGCEAPDVPAPNAPMSDEEWLLFEQHAAANACEVEGAPGTFETGHGGVVWQHPPLACVPEVETFEISAATLTESALSVSLASGGGCERLRLNLHWDGEFDDSGVSLALTNTYGSCVTRCGAAIEGTAEFDVGPVLEAWQASGREGVPTITVSGFIVGE